MVRSALNATIPTLFIEVEYKIPIGMYLIEHDVCLYEQDYQNLKELRATKINLILILLVK